MGYLQWRTDRKWEIGLPAKLPFPIVNPIGAGDAVSSGTIHHLCAGSSPSGIVSTDEEVLRSLCWGLACGAASCSSNTNSRLETVVAEAVVAKLDVKELSSPSYA